MPSTLQPHRPPLPSRRKQSSASAPAAAPFPASPRSAQNSACHSIPLSTTSPQAPPKPPWSTRKKQAQDQAIRDIYHALHRSPHTAHHARSQAHLAHQALEGTASIRQQETTLIHWARKHSLLIQRHHLPAEFQPQDNAEDSCQMEHHVWPDPTGRRILKLTHAGHFGLWPVVKDHGWDMSPHAATPARYLSRLHAANTHLADDWVLHAIVTDSHGHVQLLSSQPAYPGTTPGDLVYSAPESQHAYLRHQQQHLIRRALAQHGFHPTTHSASTFYRPADNLALFDAHLENLLWLPTSTSQGHRLMPFDVIPMHPQGKLRENIIRALVPSPAWLLIA